MVKCGINLQKLASPGKSEDGGPEIGEPSQEDSFAYLLRKYNFKKGQLIFFQVNTQIVLAVT